VSAVSVVSWPRYGGHESHTGALSQIGLNSKRLNPRRHGIKRKVYRISKELPRPDYHNTMIKLTTGSNHNQSVAIMAMPARTTPGIPRISGHVQERATDV